MSEFRQDPVSSDWILMAPERSRRPSRILKPNKKDKDAIGSCPFELKNLKRAINWPPILSIPNYRKWRAVVVPNLFPAVTHIENCSKEIDNGLYLVRTGIGHHDLIITRDHDKSFAFLSPAQAVEVFSLFLKRYHQLVEDPCVAYASTFLNYGPRAGASIYHPHYQMLSLPIIPPDVQHSLSGSERYHKRHRRCVHCEMIIYEKKVGKRVILENKEAIVIAPFVSRKPYEIRLFPKFHSPFFEKSSKGTLVGAVKLLQEALRRIYYKLDNPDLNFFIHTAPLKKQKNYRYYHWHIEIIPQISNPAGFELSTGVDINSVDPDQVALFLKPS